MIYRQSLFLILIRHPFVCLPGKVHFFIEGVKKCSYQRSSYKLIYQGKSKRCLLKFTFPFDFHVTFTTNHWSNLEKCEDLFNVIIRPYLSPKKKELGYSEEQCSLIITDTFKDQENDEMKRLSTKNNCELVIVPHNLTNKFQLLDTSVNQAAKKFI